MLPAQKHVAPKPSRIISAPCSVSVGVSSIEPSSVQRVYDQQERWVYILTLHGIEGTLCVYKHLESFSHTCTNQVGHQLANTQTINNDLFRGNPLHSTDLNFLIGLCLIWCSFDEHAQAFPHTAQQCLKILLSHISCYYVVCHITTAVGVMWCSALDAVWRWRWAGVGLDTSVSTPTSSLYPAHLRTTSHQLTMTYQQLYDNIILQIISNLAEKQEVLMIW